MTPQNARVGHFGAADGPYSGTWCLGENGAARAPYAGPRMSGRKDEDNCWFGQGAGMGFAESALPKSPKPLPFLTCKANATSSQPLSVGSPATSLVTLLKT